MGGPNYNRFEPPSNSGKRVRTVHRSLRTNVIAPAKHRAKLIIEPILNGPWEGQWIKDRSKTSYELHRYAGSLIYDATRDTLKVRDFLRHASVETTQQWYAYSLEDVPSIGMNDLVPSLHTVST